MTPPAEEPVYLGQRLPLETPRELQLVWRPLLVIAGRGLFGAFSVALGVFLLLCGKGIGYAALGLVVEVPLGLSFLADSARSLLDGRRQRRLLRDGQLAVARLSETRTRCTYADEAGREHTLPVRRPPANLGPGMSLPVAHEPGKPEAGLPVCDAYVAIVPRGRADSAPAPIPEQQWSSNGVPLTQVIPRSVRFHRWTYVGRAFFFAFATSLVALGVFCVVDAARKGDPVELRNALLGAPILGLLGFGIFWFTCVTFLQVRRIIRYGRLGTARILSRDVSEVNGVLLYTVTYAYDDDSGRRFERTSPDPSRTLAPGALVPVFYSPADPKRSVLPDSLLGLEFGPPE